MKHVGEERSRVGGISNRRPVRKIVDQSNGLRQPPARARIRRIVLAVRLASAIASGGAAPAPLARALTHFAPLPPASERAAAAAYLYYTRYILAEQRSVARRADAVVV